jgi:outer membrane receptor protein involved in Fe transport
MSCGVRGVLVWLGAVALLGARPLNAAAQEAAPAGPLGTIAGTVLDRSTGDPVIEAGVEVVGKGKTVRTDLDGRYTIRIAPGTYELRIFAPLFQGARLRTVVVRAGQLTTADASLLPSGQAGVEVVEVVAQAHKATEATQLLRRQKAAVVSDNVSAEVIKKSPDSDAAEIVQRVPAVTVVEDKFVFVRGLGERYTSAVLNGSRLPSTDPEKRVVPLDLFPAEFIESLSIIKSYTPDLPGDFSAGLVEIELREFPETRTLNLGLSTGGNSQTTFKRFRSYEGGTFDYFGAGAEFRELPGIFPEESVQFPPAPVQRRLVGSLRNIWGTEAITAAPNSGVNFSIGDSFGPFGITFGAAYTTEYKTRRDEIRRQVKNFDEIDAGVPGEDFLFDTSTFETRLGGVVSAAYKLTDNHRLTFRSLINRNSFDEVLTGRGRTTQTPDAQVDVTQLKYREEELAFGQLGGQHHWPWVDVDWRTALARTTQEVPDTRNVVYFLRPGQEPTFSNDSAGGLRVFTSLEEILTDSALDVTVPFTTRLPLTDVWSGLKAKLKFGPAYAFRDREYVPRLFRYFSNQSLPSEELLDPRNAGALYQFGEITQPRDNFAATQEIIGGYGMLDLPIVRDRLRFVGGVRMEYSLIRIDTFDDAANPQHLRKRNLDPLPGGNLIYSPRSDMNVRLSYSRSVSRPEFRELTPALIPPLRGERALVGNPDLVQFNVESWDLRWEWFFAPGELVSFGVFYKDLDQPIERVVGGTIGSQLFDTFENTGQAELKGFEFEGRKNLGFVSPWLRHLSLVTNATYVESDVEIPPEPGVVLPNRALQGQAPFIINAVLDYTHPDWGTARLLYNTTGARITSVGGGIVPDIFEERRDQLDAVLIVPLKRFGIPLTAKLAAENLLDDRFEFTQETDRGTLIQNEYTTGIKVSFGLSYAF